MPPARTYARWLPTVLVLALGGQALTFDFVWDDRPMMLDSDVIYDRSNLSAVFQNRTMYAVNSTEQQHSHEGMQTYRPVTIASFMLDAQLFGRSPIGFHFTSLLLHVLVVLLVQRLTRELVPEAPWWVAVTAGTWFAVSPFLVEAYVWINGRSDVLATLFGCSLAWVRLKTGVVESRLRRVGMELAIVLLGVACLLAKEIGIAWLVTLPWLPMAVTPSRRTRVLGLIAPMAAVGIYGALRLAALGGAQLSSHSQAWRAVQLAPWVVVEALSELALPRYTTVRWLTFELRSAGAIELVLGALALGLLTLGAWVARKRLPSLWYGFLVSVIALAPVALIAAHGWPGFGRYLYTPAAALAPGMAIGFFELSRDPRLSLTERGLRALRTGGIGYLSLLALLTLVSASPYATEHELYESWIAGTPDHPHGYRWLGLTYMEEKRYADALAMLDAARSRDRTDEGLVWQQIDALQKLGQTPGAIELAANVAPEFHSARLYLFVTVALAQTDPVRALDYGRRCLQVDPAVDHCRFWVDRLSRESRRDPTASGP